MSHIRTERFSQARLLLRHGSPVTALAATAALLRDHGEDWPAWKLHARALDNAGLTDALAEHLDAACIRFPGKAEPRLLAAELALRAGATERADAVLTEAERRGLGAEDRLDFEVKRAHRTGDWSRLASALLPEDGLTGAAAERYWLAVAEARYREGDEPGAERALVGAEIAPERLSEALGPIAEVIAGLDAPRAAARLLGWARLRSADPAHWQPLVDRLAAAYPDHDRIANPARIAGPGMTLPPDGAAWLRSVLQMRTLDRHEPIDEAQTARTAEALATALDGEFEAASGALDEIAAGLPAGGLSARLGDLAAILRRLEGDPGRDLLADEPGAEMLVSPPGREGRAALAFTGLAEHFFGLPVPLFDRLLALAGYQTILLRDRSRRGFACGLRSLGPTAQTTREALRARLEADGCRHLLSLGASGGGFASLRYGLDLGAAEIVCFSGGTVCTPEDMEALGDRRAAVITRRTLKDATDADYTRSVRTVLAERAGPTPPIRMFFPADSEIDRRHAELIAGMPGVSLKPLAGMAQHNILLAAFRRESIL